MPPSPPPSRHFEPHRKGAHRQRPRDISPQYGVKCKTGRMEVNLRIHLESREERASVILRQARVATGDRAGLPLQARFSPAQEPKEHDIFPFSCLPFHPFYNSSPAPTPFIPFSFRHFTPPTLSFLDNPASKSIYAGRRIRTKSRPVGRRRLHLRGVRGGRRQANVVISRLEGRIDFAVPRRRGRKLGVLRGYVA